MAEERVQRRLAAILAADVVGYSRLMGEDETGTLTALKQHRAALIDPTIAEYRGRIVKLMGDGVLVEFASVVDAVECAVSIQSGMVDRNEDKGPAFFAYATNYLIDVQDAVIVDVEASRAIRQAEVGAARTMIERTKERFDLKPERLAADTAYGSAKNLAWLVEEQGIAPHIPVFDKSRRKDGTFSRSDFTFDRERNLYICPQGKPLTTTGKVHDGTTRLYRASTYDCGSCPLKQRCCPNTPQRKIPRDVHEDARDVARALAKI